MRTFDFACHMLIALVTFALGGTLMLYAVAYSDFHDPIHLGLAASLMVIGLTTAGLTMWVDYCEEVEHQRALRQRMGLDPANER